MAINPTQKQNWLKEFQLNGYVVLRNFLPVEFVDRMAAELAPLLESEFAKADKDGFESGRATGRMAVHLEQYSRVMRGALADDLYQANPVIEELVDAVLGEGKWDRGWTLVEANRKGSSHMAWHSDQKPDETPDMSGPHEILRVTYNIPLIDFTWETGAMEMLPGSHHLPRDFGSLEGIANIYPQMLRMNVGDALFRDGNIQHRGTPNLSDDIRPMLDQTYKKRVGA